MFRKLFTGLKHAARRHSTKDVDESTDNDGRVTASCKLLPRNQHTPQTPSGVSETIAPSLWDRAYDLLGKENPRLVRKYAKLLSREVGGTASNTNKSGNGPPDEAEDSLDETDSQIDDANLKTRRAQLDKIIENGLKRMDEKKVTYTIAGHDFDPQEMWAQAAGFALWMKNFVEGAVKASPEASLAWAGVCVILPLLTNPSTAEQANREGFYYVTSRMGYYVALEPLIRPEEQDQAVTKELKEEFEALIVNLYKHILDFQLQSVLRFYRSRLSNLGRALIQHEDWKAMLSNVKDLENVVDKKSKQINTALSRQALEKLIDSAEESFDAMRNLLSVGQQQLQVTEQLLDSSSHQLRVQQEISKATDDMNDALGKIYDATQTAIDLPTSEKARYDSADVREMSTCQKDTRMSIRNQISEWANAESGGTIFWLSGPAGTGKSTIARSMADFFAAQKKLAAGYFFKRGEEGRNGAARFFPTIASQLADNIPLFETCLRKSLKGRGKAVIESKALDSQFEILILRPLRDLLSDGTATLTRVVVVDALDECEQTRHVPQILDLFARLREIQTVRLRVFLTSRRDPCIADSFNDMRKQGTVYSSLNLNDQNFRTETKEDILAFLETSFAKIRGRASITGPWPDPKDLSRLANLATNPSPLFIYAATLCRFVYDEQRRENPKDLLKQWLQQCDSNAPQLNQIYAPLLNYVLFGSYKQGERPRPLQNKNREQLRLIMGSVVLLAEPLSTRDLGALLDIDEDDVNHWLRNFDAVLDRRIDPQSPVRLLHKSFGDFLLGQEGAGIEDFQVDLVGTHAMLASRCIQRMKDGLSLDSSRNRDLGKPRDSLDMGASVRGMSPDLKYACLHWVYHLLQDGQCTVDEEMVSIFLQNHLVRWIESVRILHDISDGTPRSVAKSTTDGPKYPPQRPKDMGQHGGPAPVYTRIRNLIMYGMLRSTSLSLSDVLRVCRRSHVEVNELCCDLSVFNTKDYDFSTFVRTLASETSFRYESVIKYVALPDLNCPASAHVQATHLAEDPYEMKLLFDWLQRRGVSQIVELSVPGCLRCPLPDYDVAYYVNGFAIKVLRWKKLDLNLGSLTNSNELQELHLYSSGNPLVHDHWYRDLKLFPEDVLDDGHAEVVQVELMNRLNEINRELDYRWTKNALDVGEGRSLLHVATFH